MGAAGCRAPGFLLCSASRSGAQREGAGLGAELLGSAACAWFGRWWWYRAVMLRVLGCTTATEPGLRCPFHLQIRVKSGSSLLPKQLCWELPCSSSPGGLAVLLSGSATWPGKVSTSSVPKRTLVNRERYNWCSFTECQQPKPCPGHCCGLPSKALRCRAGSAGAGLLRIPMLFAALTAASLHRHLFFLNPTAPSLP